MYVYIYIYIYTHKLQYDMTLARRPRRSWSGSRPSTASSKTWLDIVLYIEAFRIHFTHFRSYIITFDSSTTWPEIVS